MELAHSADDELAGLGILMASECRVFPAHDCKGLHQLVLVAQSLRLDCD